MWVELVRKAFNNLSKVNPAAAQCKYTFSWKDKGNPYYGGVPRVSDPKLTVTLSIPKSIQGQDRDALDTLFWNTLQTIANAGQEPPKMGEYELFVPSMKTV